MRKPPAALVSLVLLVGALAAVPADPPAAAPDKVAKLIEQLGSPDFRTREAASKELEAVGGPALSALRKAAESADDMEAARRAAELADRIAKRVDNDRTLAPTLVRLNAEDKPLADVLADLGKQSGYKVTVSGSGAADKRVTVKTAGKVPFWSAVDAVCAAADLEVAPAPPAAAAVPYVMPPMRAVPPPGQARVPLRPLAPPPPPARDGPAPAPKPAPPAKAEEKKPAPAAAKPAGEDEKKKRDEEARRKQKEEMERLLKQLLAQQAEQLAAEQAGRAAVPPAEAGTVVLRPRSGKPNPSCVGGAVRVEAVHFPAAALGAEPGGTIPVLLRATPEPKLHWERVESVRVNKATDDAGRDLTAAAPAAAEPAATGRVVLMPVNGGGNWIPVQEPGSSATGFQPTADLALVRLKAGDAAPKSLKAFEGVVRAVVRTGPEELAAVTGLGEKAAPPAAGPNGVGLTVTGFAPRKDEPGAFELDVATRYTSGDVKPTGGSDNAEEVVFARGGGRVIVRRQVQGVIVFGGPVPHQSAYASNQTTVAGVRVSDADGKPYTLQVVSHRRQFDQGGVVTDQLKLVARPAGKDQGKPAKVSFHGTRAKTVEVPFKLADVPVSLTER